MAYFAKLGTGNIVEQVISISNSVITDNNGIEQEQLGIDFINNLYNTNDNWKQTSYNTNGEIHSLGGKPFRKNYAGIGYIYDSNRNAFIPPKPFNSWVLNESSCQWEAPIARPQDDNNYKWNESTLTWNIV
jgi:hypothetical protein